MQLRWVKFTGNGKLVQYRAEQAEQAERGQLSFAPSSLAPGANSRCSRCKRGRPVESPGRHSMRSLPARDDADFSGRCCSRRFSLDWPWHGDCQGSGASERAPLWSLDAIVEERFHGSSAERADDFAVVAGRRVGIGYRLSGFPGPFCSCQARHPRPCRTRKRQRRPRTGDGDPARQNAPPASCAGGSIS